MTHKQPKRNPRPGIDEYGRTTLHNAVIDKDLARTQAALDAGADVNATDDDGWTALHFAAQDHSVAIGDMLLRAGAAVDPQDSNGNTPLWTAVMNAHGQQFIDLLTEHGADPFIKNFYDVSPHDIESDSE